MAENCRAKAALNPMNIASNFIHDKSAHHINEFFVMKQYRRNGVGSFAAKAVFDKFKGKWEVCQMPKNLPARKFWKAVISDYTQNNYQEHSNDNDEWVGFTFDNTIHIDISAQSSSLEHDLKSADL